MREAESGAASRLDGVLAWNFTRAARLIGNRLADRLDVHGMNPIQFGVLAFLARDEELTTAEIARAVLLRPQSVVPLLDQLEARGLTRRTGGRERGRRNPVQITARGRAALEDVWTIAEETNDLTDVGLTPIESEELNRLLLKVIGPTG
ncbi:transcriptional regulator, MarR family [Rathayibacter oskolensis]|uniref:Transcriptional regulator, MarR family n=1 Tax=Rathayibacter oskolensis TaxID=1891671 RepID=A0A1X7NY89_9MICO|nr:MarR family winged helix-turn-helix transcriptional regulator [Rathayibacter oskolensis]SMH42768.1 transcriptional regulator, MarR family [Rathayibacter oskolensis]